MFFSTTTRRRKRSILPGFGLALGFTLLYFSLLVLIPLGGLVVRGAQMSWEQFWTAATAPRALASYRLTFGTAFLAAAINVVCGAVVAWVLVRYRFPFRRVVTRSWICRSRCRRPWPASR